MSDDALQEPYLQLSINSTTVKIIGEHHTNKEVVSYVSQKLSEEHYDAICVESCRERFSMDDTKSTESIDVATHWAKINDIPLYLIDMPESNIATQLSFVNLDDKQYSFPSEVIHTNPKEGTVLVDYNKLLKHQIDTAEDHPQYWDLFWEKRTQYMANKVEQISFHEEYDSILIIVGLGHQQRLRIELATRDNGYPPEVHDSIDPVSFT